MSSIISFEEVLKEKTGRVIDVSSVIASQAKRKIDDGLILPSSGNEIPEQQLAGEHTSEPIKSIDDIERVSDYLIKNNRFRDNMMFILGINFGLRISDLLSLTFSMLINDDCTFKDTFPILEKKTRNTRKVARNRYITINNAVVDAVTLYLKNIPSRLDEYMFKCEGNRGGFQNKPLSRVSADRILKGIANDLDLDIKMSTHTLRKTFGYHQMLMSDNDPRKLLLLQKIFGHSSVGQTLEYIGITNEEIEDAYMKLNLGSKNHYAAFSKLKEESVAR